MATAEASPERAATGIEGLDDILGGGFPRGQIYLVEGDPGAGKTTLGLQFLLEGARRGEPGIFMSLSHTRRALETMLQSHGWSPDGITVCELGASEESLKAELQYTVFHPSDVELSDTTRTILDTMERVQATRVVFDSLAEMRVLAQDPLRFRRQIWALKDYFTARGCTVLLLNYRSAPESDLQVHSLANGVLSLEQLTPQYGGQRRRLQVQKMWAVRFRDGYHDFTIRTGGLVVYPRLIAAEHRADLPEEVVSTGLPELDTLLGGGLDRGTSTLITGPAGVGKSVLAAQYVTAAAQRGERAAIYLFDEGLATFTARAEGLGMKLREHMAAERIGIRPVDPTELSPGQFAGIVREAVEERGVQAVVIDSIDGYRIGMPDEVHLTAHLHELVAYLNQQGVATLLVLGQRGLIGEEIASAVDMSYLADNMVLLRYFEAAGEVRRAISVVKRRSRAHTATIRELRLDAEGVRVGEELREFQGVLTGQPVYTGGAASLMGERDASSGA